jgi:hypothetical protein
MDQFWMKFELIIAQFISARALVCFEPAKTFVQRPEKHRIPPHPKASKGEGETSGDRV